MDVPTAFSKYILAEMRKMSEKKMLKFRRKVINLAMDILEEKDDDSD